MEVRLNSSIFDSKARERLDTVLISFRAEKHMRDAFNKVCEELDTTASQELRKFMREFIRKNNQMSI